MSIKNFKNYILENPEDITFKKGDVVERLPREGVIDKFNKVGTLYQLEDAKYDEYDGWRLTVLGGGTFTYANDIKDVRKLTKDEIESRQEELKAYLKNINIENQISTNNNIEFLKNNMTNNIMIGFFDKLVSNEEIFNFDTSKFEIELKVKRK